MSDTTGSNYLKIPSGLEGFEYIRTEVRKQRDGREVCYFIGKQADTGEHICEHCRSKMYKNDKYSVQIKHLNFGNYYTCLEVERERYYCPRCRITKVESLPFKADKHQITKPVQQFIIDLLETNSYTLRQLASLTGVCKNIIKSIDYNRLKQRYYNEKGFLKVPERQARILGIDEFKLHNGHKYATHITDLETGHVLWIEEGKKKQVVYDFIEHVGLEWMDGVEAVACDMNSDFQEAFEEKCPHIQPVFDYFHIVKNFNDKVISEVRKDEQERLLKEGKKDAAKSLKNSKYILMSKRSTLKKKI